MCNLYDVNIQAYDVNRVVRCLSYINILKRSREYVWVSYSISTEVSLLI